MTLQDQATQVLMNLKLQQHLQAGPCGGGAVRRSRTASRSRWDICPATLFPRHSPTSPPAAATFAAASDGPCVSQSALAPHRSVAQQRSAAMRVGLGAAGGALHGNAGLSRGAYRGVWAAGCSHNRASRPGCVRRRCKWSTSPLDRPSDCRRRSARRSRAGSACKL